MGPTKKTIEKIEDFLRVVKSRFDRGINLVGTQEYFEKNYNVPLLTMTHMVDLQILKMRKKGVYSPGGAILSETNISYYAKKIATKNYEYYTNRKSKQSTTHEKQYTMGELQEKITTPIPQEHYKVTNYYESLSGFPDAELIAELKKRGYTGVIYPPQKDIKL